ncbi:transmembrane emp24 domain-containing protein 10-like isoform X3 [Sceloporus undulatus]|uniref:transmembrane emp24 domain-containing protein 10-like isoform X3 n=1 Tax=Sceloporus undulatus TaxID=8520 RepID=UPI001C4B2DF6|nr:transmembrane emp24 domain-containing protein 10-like isoform X3 [Sceloporus undulatus]
MHPCMQEREGCKGAFKGTRIWSGKRMEGMLVFLLMVWGCWALSFHLPPGTPKCLKEALQQDVMVTGEYEVSPGTSIDLKVTDSVGHLLYSKDDAKKGQLSFITEDCDIYEICFRSRGRPGNSQVPDQLVTLNIKRGVEARNYKHVSTMLGLPGLTPNRAAPLAGGSGWQAGLAFMAWGGCKG